MESVAQAMTTLTPSWTTVSPSTSSRDASIGIMNYSSTYSPVSSTASHTSSTSPSSITTSSSTDYYSSLNVTESSLTPASLHSFARSLSTYLAIGAVILGIFVAICLASWLYKRRKRQKRFKSKFGEDDEEENMNWNDGKTRRVWDPETGMGVIVKDETRQEKDTLTPRERGCENERRRSMMLEDAVESPVKDTYLETVKPTMRLITTLPNQPSGMSVDWKDKDEDCVAVVVEGVHSGSSSPVLSPERESKRRLLDRKQKE
ncbi:uncharacterized protein L203_106212 [Cryptococcus depauperatus CBS 7841]|uniref:Uncharacterized protein n=1 Tax=Cryptococcus depauperatus CBS 7841 TaxID=1295531 RepID=A0AAJ8JYS0_9TREE